MKPSDPFISIVHDCTELIMRRSMRHFFQYAKGIGLSMPQIGTLFHLTRGGTSGISNISDDLGVSNAATSQMLDRLVQQELILRSEDPDDRRVKKIVLTEKGQRILEELIQVRQAWVEELAAALSPGEKEQIVTAFKILIAKVNPIDQPAP
jgi:DNA-binding MarR family transcriptional regulator